MAQKRPVGTPSLGQNRHLQSHNISAETVRCGIQQRMNVFLQQACNMLIIEQAIYSTYLAY